LFRRGECSYGDEVCARTDRVANREHQQALYAFGGGGSGAAMRLRGLKGCV
jgi:hypothetical protein